jgi:hypothetical protein
MKRMFVATGIVLALVFMVFTASAKADVSFVGGGASGVDPNFGETWQWNTTVGGVLGPGAGASAWGIPGLGAGTLVWHGPTMSDFDIVFGTAFTVMPPISLIPTAGAGYDETTRFWVNGTYWNVISVSPTEVQFFAPTAASALYAGDSYFVNVVLTGPINPAQVGFVATWSPVPLPPSLLLLAPGLLGLVGARKRFKG